MAIKKYKIYKGINRVVIMIQVKIQKGVEPEVCLRESSVLNVHGKHKICSAWN